MKKVAVLTINDDNNYGNRLQNYAVQEILKKHKIQVETISNQDNIVGLKYLKKQIKKQIKKILANKAKYKRYNLFMEFNNNIKYSKYHIDKKHIPDKLKDKYDYFITGSDQVWNPNFNRLSEIDLIEFAKNEKRISFSASFGISELPEKYKEKTANALKDFKAISVREDAGKEIVEKLTKRKDVEVLVDPTMLLTAEEWDKISKKPEQLETNKYILNYFLGKLSEEREKEINRIAKENGCEVINILDKNSQFYQTGPSEFLYLEKNAFLICTDSFHSSVFAILYNRPFIVFEREDNNINMNSRIDTLINKFNLKGRRFLEKITEENLKHDYTEAYQILEKEKQKSNNFLKKALDIEK